MKIFDERISNRVDNVVEYRVKVTQFKDKMEKWKPGRKINSLSPFFFMDCKFSLGVYPNGSDDERKGFVSVFLRNENCEGLYVSFSVILGLQNQTIENMKIGSNDGYGWGKFYGHWIKEDDDDKLEIVCRITKVMKDKGEHQLESVLRSDIRDLASSRSKENKRLVKHETDMKNRFTSIMQGQNTMQIEFKKKMDEVTKELKKMKCCEQHQQQPVRFDDDHYHQVPKPKCVKCGSNLTSASQIDQCPAGHLMCLICKDISGEARCPICHEPMTRATGLESYLKILFPTTVENYEFLSKDNSPQNISNLE